jgi:threonine dehydrogenase-like Zn-dependent dehydrogenase
MEALVFTDTSKVELLNVAEPQPAEDEVVVDVVACGICGSELHGIQHPGFRQPPLVMGHEFVGTDPKGRRVIVNPIVSCGHCDMCQRHQEQLCRTRSIIGIHRSGGFGERVSVPSNQLYEIPSRLSWEEAALIEPLANAVHAWELVASLKPRRVGVVGAGTIGLVCLLVSRLRGATEVAVADLAEDRLAMARKLGASEAGTQLEGEFDAVFDCVGLPATRKSAVAQLRPGGAAVFLGLLSPDAGFDTLGVIRQEKMITGSFAYPRAQFEKAIEDADKVDLTWGTSFPLDKGDVIFTELMKGRTDVAKALLRPARIPAG